MLTILFPLSYTTQSKIAVPLNEKSLAPKKVAKKAHIRTYEKENYYYMKVDNLKIGNTYYVTIGNKAHSFKVGTLVEIVNKSSVILEDKKGKRFKCSANRLHKTADKAVMGKKSKMAARQYMNEEKQKKEESLIDNNVQDKVKKLGHSVYATMVKNKYVVKGYEQPITFSTLEELDNWVNIELEKFETIKEEILNKGYKHLCVTCKDGHKEYYSIINISFKKFEIFCKHFKGKVEDITKEKLLMREDVSGLTMRIHK